MQPLKSGTSVSIDLGTQPKCVFLEKILRTSSSLNTYVAIPGHPSMGSIDNAVLTITDTGFTAGPIGTDAMDYIYIAFILYIQRQSLWLCLFLKF